MTIELIDDNGLIYNKRPAIQDPNWVVVHNGVNAVIFDNTSGEISSQHAIIEFNTEQEAIDYMDVSNIDFSYLVEDDGYAEE